MRKRIVGIVLLLAFLAGGFFVFRRPQLSQQQAVIYHCPMHPEYTSPQPGDCPICGMHLVPVAAKEHGAHAGHQTSAAGETAVAGYAPITLDAKTRTALGVVTEKAAIRPIEREINTVGRITYDENRLFHVHTRFEGYIEKLFVTFVGQQVKLNDPLFSVYSPELLVTEKEYLLARKGAATGSGNDLSAAARKRLELWDIGKEEIARLDQSGQASAAVVIRSPVSGFVTSKTAIQGMRITPNDTVFDIADLSKVWLQADVYESDLPFVQIGQKVEISLLADPGTTRQATLSYLSPVIDEKTRTAKARIVLDNESYELKPEMFANVSIKSSRGPLLSVPDPAVLWTGERKIVFVEQGEGVFTPRQVTVGVKGEGYVEVLSGLSPGETVVASANFLIDSESRLRAAGSR